jgi:hypothetical protein
LASFLAISCVYPKRKKKGDIVFGCISPNKKHDYVNQNIVENFFEFGRMEF